MSWVLNASWNRWIAALVSSLMSASSFRSLLRAQLRGSEGDVEAVAPDGHALQGAEVDVRWDRGNAVR